MIHPFQGIGSGDRSIPRVFTLGYYLYPLRGNVLCPERAWAPLCTPFGGTCFALKGPGLLSVPLSGERALP